MPEPKLTAIAPHLLVSDIEAAAAYYRDCLGFTYEWMWGEPPSFVMVTRDDLTIMLTQNRYDDRPGDTNPNGRAVGHDDQWDAAIWLDDLDAAHSELSASGANVVRAPYDMDYGMRELLVADPDAHHICFGGRISQQTDHNPTEDTAMSDTRAKLSHVAPVLLVSDVQASAAYYRDKLGFTYEKFWGEPPSFVMMNRDGLTIMLAQHSHDDGPGDTNPNARVTGHDDQWDAYIWVDDVNALFAEVKAAGAEIAKEPYETFYDMREFQVADPDGYQIGFGGSIGD
ncbi:hypothetical protein HN371_03195 [Candidatus Poribacteria bacterium]|nr:hypothetical protein [Candidatus Poribacteria bacterium]MBT5533665.1 hypothetical protein [Candidatus Poribacteria bacterium]MBT5711781.1 hypothetical protein [Candidatus Poribacteria bacterium]MBT7098275.1 hypothetical protein [Candidatus Poribacteria bacterium]MBT7809422.1 hypothetical protein [Candidatus Poribacteria bacterium]